jgi:hypothetical protein
MHTPRSRSPLAPCSGELYVRQPSPDRAAHPSRRPGQRCAPIDILECGSELPLCRSFCEHCAAASNTFNLPRHQASLAFPGVRLLANAPPRPRFRNFVASSIARLPYAESAASPVNRALRDNVFAELSVVAGRWQAPALQENRVKQRTRRAVFRNRARSGILIFGTFRHTRAN